MDRELRDERELGEGDPFLRSLRRATSYAAAMAAAEREIVRLKQENHDLRGEVQKWVSKYELLKQRTGRGET